MKKIIFIFTILFLLNISFALNCGYDFNESGTYLMDSNLNCPSTFVFSEDNITLDCSGHSIVADSLIFNLTNRDNITIKNCNLSSFKIAEIDNSYNIVIENSTIYSAFPITILDSGNISINQNNFTYFENISSLWHEVNDSECYSNSSCWKAVSSNSMEYIYLNFQPNYGGITNLSFKFKTNAADNSSAYIIMKGYNFSSNSLSDIEENLSNNNSWNKYNYNFADFVVDSFVIIINDSNLGDEYYLDDIVITRSLPSYVVSGGSGGGGGVPSNESSSNNDSYEENNDSYEEDNLSNWFIITYFGSENELIGNINLVDVENINISNNNINGFFVGVLLNDFSDEISIFNNNINCHDFSNPRCGFGISGEGLSILVENNTFEDQLINSIKLDVNNTSIRYNTILNSEGIFLDELSELEVAFNHIKNASDGLIVSSLKNLIVENNLFEDIKYKNIDIDDVSNQLILDNNSFSGGAVLLSSINNFTLINNNFKDLFWFEDKFLKNVSILENNFTNIPYLGLHGLTNSNISQNTFYNVSFDFFGVYNTSLEKNVFQNLDDFDISYSEDLSILENNFTNVNNLHYEYLKNSVFSQNIFNKVPMNINHVFNLSILNNTFDERNLAYPNFGAVNIFNSENYEIINNSILGNDLSRGILIKDRKLNLTALDNYSAYSNEINPYFSYNSIDLTSAESAELSFYVFSTDSYSVYAKINSSEYYNILDEDSWNLITLNLTNYTGQIIDLNVTFFPDCIFGCVTFIDNITLKINDTIVWVEDFENKSFNANSSNWEILNQTQMQQKISNNYSKISGNNISGFGINVFSENVNSLILENNIISDGKVGLLVNSSNLFASNNIFYNNIGSFDLISNAFYIENSIVNITNGIFKNNSNVLFNNYENVSLFIDNYLELSNNDMYVNSLSTSSNYTIILSNATLYLGNNSLYSSNNSSEFIFKNVNIPKDSPFEINSSSFNLILLTQDDYIGNITFVQHKTLPFNLTSSSVDLKNWMDISAPEINLSQATLTIKYNETYLNENKINLNTLKIAYFNDSNGSLQFLNSSINQSGKYVQANITHFSWYGLFGDKVIEQTQSPNRNDGGGNWVGSGTNNPNKVNETKKEENLINETNSTNESTNSIVTEIEKEEVKNESKVNTPTGMFFNNINVKNILMTLLGLSVTTFIFVSIYFGFFKKSKLNYVKNYDFDTSIKNLENSFDKIDKIIKKKK